MISFDSIIQVVVILFFPTVAFLDLYSIYYPLSKKFIKNNKATVLNLRQRIQFVMRGCVGLMGPILAILIFNTDYDNVFNIFLIGLLIGAISYLIFTAYLISKLKRKKKFSFNIKGKNINYFLGSFIFFLIINTPFLINFGNIYFKFQSSFFLQLYPLINSVSSIYLLYYYDRAMSLKIDHEKIDNNIISDYLIQRGIFWYIAAIFTLLCLI